MSAGDCTIDSTCPCGATFRYMGPTITGSYRHDSWLAEHRHCRPAVSPEEPQP